MRHVLIRDKKIPQAEVEAWKITDTDFWQKHAGITPTYFDQEYDFTDYPTEIDNDGDVRPKDSFVKELTEDIYKRYSADGTDFIMLLIHQDNWKSGKIWGTNWSNKYRNYHVQYCRWDKKNPANVFGTLYHERHHALDALIATETGIDVNDILDVNTWDSQITHGKGAEWDYIRYKENTQSIELIAPYLKDALVKRQKRHDDYIKGQKLTIIGLLEKMVYLYRQQLYKKDGVKK